MAPMAMAIAIGEHTDRGENTLANAALERVKQHYREVDFPNKITETKFRETSSIR